MLILPIEKEIETEHKIIGRFNPRQAVCGGAIIASIVLFYLSLGDLFLTIVCTMPFLAVFGVLGWYTKCGLNAEDVALKILQEKYYKNQVRKYRTRNKYFALYNRAYARKREQKKSRKRGVKNGRGSKKNQ